jgi:hypothetical protein
LRASFRSIRADEDLDLIFTWRTPRCVSDNLTIRYDKQLFLLEASPSARLLAGKYIEVYHYPGNRIEARYCKPPGFSATAFWMRPGLIEPQEIRWA